MRVSQSLIVLPAVASSPARLKAAPVIGPGLSVDSGLIAVPRVAMARRVATFQSRVVVLKPPVASVAPAGLNAMDSTDCWPVASASPSGWRVVKSHIRTVPSSEADTRWVPLWLNTRLVMPPVCPRKGTPVCCRAAEVPDPDHAL